MCVGVRVFLDKESSSLCTMFFVNFYSRLSKLLGFYKFCFYTYFLLHAFNLFGLAFRKDKYFKILLLSLE